MSERYVRFNVQELKLAAAQAVGRNRCVGIKKLAEGGFNWVFLLTMDDGFEVIARIPTTIAGPPRYATASEVATMDFLRRYHDLPVPKVFAYSSRVDGNNPVGTEYIIMERVHGSSLASRWQSLSKKELVDVIEQVASLEEKVLAIRFPMFGSLYYKEDVESSVEPARGCKSEYLPDEFAIGPLAKRQFWFDERAEMEIDRGPCSISDSPYFILSGFG
jgi:aminoglycoside phosphotransferase (APT) family kinase protein